MTEDRIRAIAEEYARHMCQTTADVQQRKIDECIEYDFAKPVIEYLNERYCIVEREKVTEKYNAIKYLNGIGCQDRLDLLKDLFGTSMFNKNEAQYTEQCETCMRKVVGEVLEVCKNSTDENRHCKWDNGKIQDFCVYKIFWDRYPEAHWRTVLTPEQFNLAKSLNQDKE